MITHPLDFGKCTQEDRKKFFDPKSNCKNKIDKMFETGGMYCLKKLDWKGEKLKLYGKNDLMAFRRIDLNLVACNATQITEENKHLN